MITETTRKVLDALEALETEVFYDAETGEYEFAYMVHDMVLMPSTEEGGVCFAAEFILDRYLDPILELWVDVINKDGAGFVVKEDRPGVGRIYKEWLVDWEDNVSEDDVHDMLCVMAKACTTISHNLLCPNIPGDEDYVGMNEVLTQIAKISSKIENSPYCGYLYQYFDELVASLDSARTDGLPPIVVRDLKGLIQDMAVESIYNNVSSANWIRYSARAFYCADYLVRYLPEDQREFFYGYLNGFFSDLVDSGVAPIIEKEVFDKYLKMNLTEENYHTMYDRLIHKAICEWDKCRLWRADEVGLACDYSKSINHMIRSYIKGYRDYSVLKEWIPKLRISHAVKHRDGYPESTWFENAGSAEREAVMRTLDNIVQIYGYLHCLWYWHSPEELIGTMPTEGLINMFESFDDRAFDDILCDIAEFMSNSKVKDVLMHFAGHNDKVVAGLARQLLSV